MEHLMIIKRKGKHNSHLRLKEILKLFLYVKEVTLSLDKNWNHTDFQYESSSYRNQ